MSTRQQMRGVFAQVSHVVAFQDFVGLSGDLFLGKPEVLHAKGEVFFYDRKDNLVVWILKDEPNLATHILAVAGGIKPVHLDRSRRRQNQPVQQARKRRFA